MSKNTYRMTGIFAMLISVFLLMGGLYLPQAGISKVITTSCIISGLMFLIVGIVFYKILKTD